MEDFLYKTQILRALDAAKIKTMTKKQLLTIVNSIGNGPTDILVHLSHAVTSSFSADKHLAEQFVDGATQTLWLVLGLFEDVFSFFPGESKETAQIITDGLNDELRRVKTFSI